MFEPIIDRLEIKFWQVAKWVIRRGYGADCSELDYVEFGGDHPRELNSAHRCPGCRAKEVITWIDEHIDLIRMCL